MSARNKWGLVTDENVFLDQVADEIDVLEGDIHREERVRLAVRRTYSAVLYHALRQRNDQAFEELAAVLMQMAVRDHWELSVAEDLTQETVAQVFSKLDVLKSPASLFAWVFSIYRDIRRSYLSRSRSQESLELLGASNVDVMDQVNIEEDVGEKILSAEVVALIRQALPNNLECIVLTRVVLLGDHPRDIALELNLPMSRIRLAKSRALERIRRNETYLHLIRRMVGEDTVNTDPA